MNARVVIRAAAGALALAVLAGCMPYSTGPTQVGVRTVKFALFGKKGVQDKVYQPGQTHFFVPFINDWHTFDTRLQNLEMSAQAFRENQFGRDDMMFKTIDGNDISLDIVISYKINPEQAPFILQNVATTDEELRENVVRTIARSKPRDLFGELNTEDFYIAPKRSAKAEEVRARLNEMLLPYGVVVERVGTRDYRFNPAYQKAIEDKKVADQQVDKNRASTKAAEEEYLKKVEEALGEVAKMKAEADGEYERAKIEADAYFEQQRQLAEAILAEGRAEAEALRKMNEALAGAGGEALVRMAVAESLMNKRILLLPIGAGGLDVRSTDINSLLDFYGLKQLTSPRPQ